MGLLPMTINLRLANLRQNTDLLSLIEKICRVVHWEQRIEHEFRLMLDHAEHYAHMTAFLSKRLQSWLCAGSEGCVCSASFFSPACTSSHGIRV